MTTALKRISGFGLILIFGLSAVIAGQTPQPGNPDVQTLVLNKPLERTIRGGETHSFTFDVKAGYRKIIDVIISLFILYRTELKPYHAHDSVGER